MSLPVMPAAMPAPMMAPIDEPAIAVGLMPSSSSVSITWICERPRAPPPPNATAKLGPSDVAAPAVVIASSPVVQRRSEHHDRWLRRQQLSRYGAHLVKGDVVDEVDAA